MLPYYHGMVMPFAEEQEVSEMKEDGSCTDGDRVNYERPILTPIGNLHDLLAGSGTRNGDQVGPSVACGAGGGSFFACCVDNSC